MSDDHQRIEVITGAARRRRWMTEEKLRIVDETLRSGESISIVARRHGVVPNLLYRWRRLMTEGGAVAVQADDAVMGNADAVHKLEWYALRWKIETFFRTLKTGCRIEELRLAAADRLANYLALCCVVAWRVSWLTMLSRETPAADPAAVFTEDERHLLDRTTPDRKRRASRDLGFYVRAVARLGGYLDRASDAPPGTTVIWRGFSRLADLVEGRVSELVEIAWRRNLRVN